MRAYRASSFVGVLLVLGFSRQADAIDLTGTWIDVKSSCVELAPDGTKKKLKESQVQFSPMLVTQSGHDTNVRFGSSDNRGLVFWEAKNPDEGQGLISPCSFAPLAMFQIKRAKTHAPDKNGFTGKLVTLSLKAGPAAVTGNRICKATFRRTSTADPGAPGCP